MKLYLIHCGFYDTDLCDGIYEGHVNFFVAAEDFDRARVRAKEIPEFKAKKMHVDGVQEVAVVGGYQIKLEQSAEHQGRTIVVSSRHRDLATKPAQPTQ